MADSNLNTSISALVSQLVSETPTASVDELVKITRAAEVIGQSEHTSLETALNTRVNALVSTASVDELSKLARSISAMKEPQVQSTSVDMSALSQDIVPANNNGIDIGHSTRYIDDIYANNIIINTGTIAGTPTNATDIANKSYVDSSISTIAADILPDTDATYDIGSSSATFVNIHAAAVKGLSAPVSNTDAANKEYVDNATGGTNTVTSINGITGTVTINTDDIDEGIFNQYYTDARVDTHLNQSTATNNQVLSWNGTDYAWVNQTGGSAITLDGGDTLANGDFLLYDSSNSHFGFVNFQSEVQSYVTAGTNNINVQQLTDVDSVDTLASGDILLHDGSEFKFVNFASEVNTYADARIASTNIQGLSDVNSGDTIANGDVLLYDSGNSHFGFVNLGSEITGYLSTYATQGYVNTQIANLVDSAPSTLDTLNELAAALSDDPNFATTITNQIAAKADPYSTAPVTVSGGKYYIDGEQQVILTLQPGRTYRFDQSDASNNSHPLRFSEVEDGTHAGGGATEYTTGVTVNGTAGNSGAYVEIEVTHATPRLYYYCGNHSGMGGKVSVGKEMFVERIDSDTWITGPIQTTSVNVGTGGQINASTATLDFTHTTTNFSGATVAGLSNSDVNLANIVDNAQGVVVTGKVAADSLDIGTGGAINASTATLDFTHTLVNFSGANVGGLSDTIQDEVDFHLNKSNSSGQTIISDGQVLSWNATGGLQGTGDYEWVAQSSGGGGGGSASIEISETAPSSPTAGTMWFDSSVGKTFIYYNDGNTSQWVQMNPSSSGTLTVGSSAPASPSTGEQWYNTNDGALYIYYNDGDSSQWVGVSGPAGPAGESGAVTIGDNPPSSPTDGQQWFDSSDGSLYIYYNDGTSNQWVATSGPASVASTSSSWLEKNANYTVVAGEKLLVDCSGGAKTITLPVSANMGDEIRIIDATGNASTNNITVARNGHKIQGVTQDLTIDTDRAAFGLVYYNSTQGWLLTER